MEGMMAWEPTTKITKQFITSMFTPLYDVTGTPPSKREPTSPSRNLGGSRPVFWQQNVISKPRPQKGRPARLGMEACGRDPLQPLHADKVRSLSAIQPQSRPPAPCNHLTAPSRGQSIAQSTHRIMRCNKSAVLNQPALVGWLLTTND